MSEIVKHSLIQTLSPTETESLKAHYFPKIKEVKRVDLVDPIGMAITKAYVVRGQKMDDLFESMVDEITHELKSNYTWLTVEEFCLAIDLGSKGKLESEFVHISVHNILKWVWLYNEKIRRPALSAQRKHEEEQAEKLEESQRKEKISIFESVIIGKYNGSPESLASDNYGTMASYYRHLDSKKLIALSNEQKKILFDEAKKIKEEDNKNLEEFKPITIEYTVEDIARAKALVLQFEIWKFEDFDLKKAL